MKILVIDGQGGGVGKQLVEGIKKAIPNADITAVGTNALAAQAMLKAGARQAATGENAVVVACRTADIIAGPVGIVVADALLGEITPKMAEAVGSSLAWRVLVPMDLCHNYIAGVRKIPVARLIEDSVQRIREIIEENTCNGARSVL